MKFEWTDAPDDDASHEPPTMLESIAAATEDMNDDLVIITELAERSAATSSHVGPPAAGSIPANFDPSRFRAR